MLVNISYLNVFIVLKKSFLENSFIVLVCLTICRHLEAWQHNGRLVQTNVNGSSGTGAI